MFLNKKNGIIIVYVLVFGTIFLVLLGGTLNFILWQLKQFQQKISWNEALEIAESGVEYYKWCLNNNIEANCPKEKDYFDPMGNLIGRFSLVASSTKSCGKTLQEEIESTGWTFSFPDLKRKVRAIYARESVGKYSYVLNSNVYIGPDHEIKGPYHSNGGIRMDGENQSIISSAQQEWICDSSFGCSASATQCYTSPLCRVENSKCVCPGVFTTTQNSNPDLFDFPVASFDFVGITVDLAEIKNISQSGGIYLPPSTTINSQAKGYHIKLKNNNTFEVWIITNLTRLWAYSLEEGWHWDYFTIKNEYLYNTYTIPYSCSVIFIEDNIWLEGEINGKISLASANLITPNLDTDVILVGNINYSSKDSTNGFGLIAERNILIGPQSPNQMELNGIFIAQN